MEGEEERTEREQEGRTRSEVRATIPLCCVMKSNL